MPNKYRISANNFMPNFRKFPIGQKDGKGNELHLGDAIKDDRGETHFIGYRYGEYALKQPNTIHTLMVTNYSRFERLEQVTGFFPDEWLIIGYVDDSLYPTLNHLEEINIVEQK